MVVRLCVVDIAYNFFNCCFVVKYASCVKECNNLDLFEDFDPVLHRIELCIVVST